MALHICLVSDQLLANYLPIKQCGVKKVLMLSTAYTRDQKSGFLSNRFAAMLRQINVDVEDYPIDIPQQNFPALLAYFKELGKKLSARNEEEIVLNLTGGSKLMALSAYECLKDCCDYYIYTNTSAGFIEYLYPTDKPYIKLDNLLNINEYFYAYGVRTSQSHSDNPEWRALVQQRRPITERFAQLAGTKHSAFISQLNYICHKAITSELRDGKYVDVLCQPVQTLSKAAPPYVEIFLKECQKFGLLTFEPEQRKVVFNKVEDVAYLGGLWLEEFLYERAREIGFDDVRCSLQIKWGKQVKNELDIAIVHNNRSLVMECKTVNFRGNESDIVYKLDSIADDLRGLSGEVCLVSALKIEENSAVLKRAERFGIKVFASKALMNITDALVRWKKGEKLSV